MQDTVRGGCYVLGCRVMTDRGAIHARFGAVLSCPSHDPGRHDQARPFGPMIGTAAIPARATGRPNVGPMAPLSPAPDTRPPSGQTATPSTRTPAPVEIAF